MEAASLNPGPAAPVPWAAWDPAGQPGTLLESSPRCPWQTCTTPLAPLPPNQRLLAERSREFLWEDEKHPPYLLERDLEH